MSGYFKGIGKNIAEIRRIKGLTQAQLAEAVGVSPQTVGAWERGDRRIYADQVQAVAAALSCSPTSVYGQRTDMTDGAEAMRQRFLDEVASLQAADKLILNHALTKWRGDKHALLQFIGLYMALPPEYRQHIALEGLLQHGIAADAGRIDAKAPPFDVAYIEKRWRNLSNKCL